MSWLSVWETAATHRDQLGLRRVLRSRGDDDGLVDLAGNDYLGLARHPDVVGAAASALKAYGAGATSSRLVRGSTDAHASLEEELASFLGCEAALVYSSGYLANLGAVRAFTLPGAVIASDAYNHASLVDGCRLASAGSGGARVVIYPHGDVAALARTLASRTGPAMLLTESVFSVHGDLAPLGSLYDLARAHDAVLCVDDAHGVGVIGPAGAGGVAAAGLAGRPNLVVTATLSKAFGAAGGVVAGPRAFIRHLVETSRSFIFDTGLPPALAAAAHTALDLIRSDAGAAARVELADRARVAAARLRTVGLAVREPAGGVLCVGAPGPEAAVAWATACREHGIAVGCFRPPSTPDGTANLRLTINAGVARDEFERALEIIVALAPAISPADADEARLAQRVSRDAEVVA